MNIWRKEKIVNSSSEKINNALKNSSISSSGSDDLTIGGDNDPVVHDILEREKKAREEAERQKNIIPTNENFVNDSPNTTKNETEKNNNIWLWLLGGVVVVGGGFLLFGGKKKKKRK